MQETVAETKAKQVKRDVVVSSYVDLGYSMTTVGEEMALKKRKRTKEAV